MFVSLWAYVSRLIATGLFISVLPLRGNHYDIAFIMLPIASGQKVDTRQSVATAPVGVRRITGAHRHLQDASRTRWAGRTRSRGAKRTYGNAAAPGAAVAHHRAPPLGTLAPARSSPLTTDRTTPGEASWFSFTLQFYFAVMWVVVAAKTATCVSRREKDSANRSDTDSRARRRSRSYSPIRKRRRDSPSFMEARRITR